MVIYNLQSGEQRSRGVELDLTLTPRRHWQVYLSYSYMDARIVEVTGNDDAILAQDPATLDAAGQVNYKNVSLLHGARLQMSAPHLANLWTRYDFAAGELAGRLPGRRRQHRARPDAAARRAAVFAPELHAGQCAGRLFVAVRAGGA